jgi:hypothetical protein
MGKQRFKKKETKYHMRKVMSTIECYGARLVLESLGITEVEETGDTLWFDVGEARYGMYVVDTDVWVTRWKDEDQTRDFKWIPYGVGAGLWSEHQQNKDPWRVNLQTLIEYDRQKNA